MNPGLPDTTLANFQALDLRAGTVVRAEDFEAARKPALKLWIDFGALGVLASSAQLTAHYSPAGLVGRQVIAAVNLGSRRIAGFESQCLVTGFPDANGQIVLAAPASPVPNGARLA